jgi:hypothetical protein
MRVPAQKAALLSALFRSTGNLDIAGLGLEGGQRIPPLGAGAIAGAYQMPLHRRWGFGRGHDGHDRVSAVYGGSPLDCLAFDEVRLALLVGEAGKAHDSRKVVDCAVTTCPSGDLFLKRRELREGDVGNTPKHMVTPLAGAGDPAGGERDVPRIRKRSAIQIRELAHGFGRCRLPYGP